MLKPTKKLTKTQFWLLSCTWGLIMTLAGAAAAAFFLIAGKKPKQNQYGWVFECGKNWGGLSLGPISIVSSGVSQHTLNHEFGHSIQNCYYGPGHIFISIASAIRYWYREYLVNCKGYNYYDLPPYDSIWFEGEATRLGDFYKNN